MDNNIDLGYLKVNITTFNKRPITGAEISISFTGNPQNVLEMVTTDEAGMTDRIELEAPPIEYSLEEDNNQQPYSEYTLNIEASGYEPVNISGVEIFSEEEAIQEVELRPMETDDAGSDIVIPPHTLFGDYPPKIEEAEVKPVNETGEIVLSRVVIPEYIIVHDGPPSDSAANNYYVRYSDYIKNVASNEIYATWPTNTIVANVLAIMSFTLNRVYTEWYRNRGYEFTITSSTAFDHKWSYGKTIYDSISRVVDEIFDQYLSFPNVKQPILTQYCDGKIVTCPGRMTQWGSKSLGDSGYSPIQILRYYYGNTMYINTAEEISGIPASWPRTNLQVGSTGDKVRQIQEQLDTIATVYTAIPRIAVDGIYGDRTRRSVARFQNIFGLDESGVVDFRTWYKISQIYVGLTRIAELN